MVLPVSLSHADGARHVPDSTQHQAGLAVASPPSLEGQGRLGCFIWACNSNRVW